MNYSDQPNHDFWCSRFCTWHAPDQPVPAPNPGPFSCGVGLPEPPPPAPWQQYNWAFEYPYEDVYVGEEIFEIGPCGLPHMTAAYDRYHKFLPGEPPTHWTIEETFRGAIPYRACEVCYPPRPPQLPGWSPGDKPTGRDPEAVRAIAEQKRKAAQGGA